MDYAKRFKEIMKERNLTQQELANLAGVRQQSISNWMGKRYPNPKYGVSFLLLFYLSGPYSG